MDARYSLTRRQLVQGAGAVGVGLLAGCGRLPGQVQPPLSPRRVGYLMSELQDLTVGPFRGFREGLGEHGLVEGRHVVLVPRSAEGELDRLPGLAGELAQLPVDVIVTSGERATRAARDATSVLPIVMVITSDPVQAGFITSLARPGGNVTGFAGLGRALTGKRLQLLQDTVPGLSKVAVLWNDSNPTVAANFATTKVAAQALGLLVQSLAVRAADDLESAFDAAVRERSGALLVLEDPLLGTHADRVVALAARSRLPAIYTVRTFINQGGLMAYTPPLMEGYRRAAAYVDKILKGASPADLPVEQPMTFDFVINLRTAEALDLTIPPHVLLQATELIQ
jgi:putative tryptophan/tyrosine transport system substrate-binding protein